MVNFRLFNDEIIFSQVLWIYEFDGNQGKTFLAHYLRILYGFVQLNGTVTTRDLTGTLPDEIHGVVIDVTRYDIQKFDYSVLEGLKNGYMCSGKYSGSVGIFKSCPVMVVANEEPRYSQLSNDRWDVVHLGEYFFYIYHPFI